MYVAFDAFNASQICRLYGHMYSIWYHQTIDLDEQSPLVSTHCVVLKKRLSEESHLRRLYGSNKNVSSEMHRVEEAGGWIDDGRVCDILAVSRAFGDCEFKGEGLPIMLRKGVE